MSDLSRYVELYRLTTEHDTEVLWSKVNIIREAIADGADVETLLTECGKESGDSAKQVRKFYAVARVWGHVKLFDDFDYWTHEACLSDPRVNPDDSTTYPFAWQWMIHASEGREIKRGKKTIHAKHTARTLRAAIRAANGDGKPSKTEVVARWDAKYRGCDIVLDYVTLQIQSHEFVKLMSLANDIDNLSFHLTITRVTSPATATAESEVAHV